MSLASSKSLRGRSCACFPFVQVEAAVAAAKKAFPGWSERSPEQRTQVLSKLADLIEANLEELAQAESRDQGVSFRF